MKLKRFAIYLSLIIATILFITIPAYAVSNFYGSTSLTGGAAGSLDSIDGSGLANGDGGFVITSTTFYMYYLNATSGAAESSPDVISPDSNPGNKRWILIFQGDAETAEIAQLAVTDGNFIVGNGSTWVAESGATARASLGAQSTLTNSAGLLAALNDETGTGLSVFSTSPDLTTAATITKTAIGTTQSDAYGLGLLNTTAAAADAQQYSPPLVFRGSGWKTDATAASMKVEFMQDVRPVQGAAPTGYWGVYPSVNDAAYSATPALAVTSGGNVGIGTTAPGAKLHLSGGDGDNVFSAATIALGYSTTGQYPNFIHTRSNGASAVGNAIDFYTSDGTAAGVYPTNAVLGMTITNGNVGIGTTSPNQKLTVQGSISLVDQAAAAADTAGYGQIWVSNATPDELWFTDDAGTDTQISSHPLDAPSELYINGPGIDWIGKRVQKYLGIIFWQKIDGTVIEETFDAYNLRRKDVPGHVDLVKRDWDTVQLAKLKAEKMKEVIEEEVTSADAFEDVEIVEEVQTGTKADGYAYTVDKDGKVIVTPKVTPIMIKQGTGKFEKQLKSGISFSAESGKFIRKRTLTEVEVDALNLKVPTMPQWMADWKAKQLAMK